VQRVRDRAIVDVSRACMAKGLLVRARSVVARRAAHQTFMELSWNAHRLRAAVHAVAAGVGTRG
jgi:hypothetical protein